MGGRDMIQGARVTTKTKKKATQMYNMPQPAADYSRTLLHVDRIAW